jgi:prepilin-type N-terminal cleavage/methylation domain-containing protein
MRSPETRPSRDVPNSIRSAPRRGFSLIELLVTVVVAAVIFAAMVPVFASALKKTSGDNLRVTAANIAQDRIEKIRQLPFDQISAIPATPTAVPNLCNPTWANSQFGPSATPVGNRAYTIAYAVDAHPSYKEVTVTVTWAGSANYVTKMDTVVMNPAAMTVQSTSNPYPQPSSGYTLTVAFKDATQLVNPYLKVTYVQGGVTKTATPSPVAPFPLSSKTSTVLYPGLPGGTNIPYTVTCYSQYITATAPIFHMLSNGYKKFDTHPGGS